MERKIGEIIRIQCVETKVGTHCSECFFKILPNCNDVPCEDLERTDKKNVKFVEMDSTFRRVDIEKFKELLEEFEIINYQLGEYSEYENLDKYQEEIKKWKKRNEELKVELEKVFEGVID